ncbi:MAG TPA: hypothetical protein VGH83_01125 [Candidatus Acidoferrum sp.]|jgi:hypothetical protein
MANIQGKFDEYTLRSVDESDRDQLTTWIENDHTHANIIEPDFFMGLTRNDAGGLVADPRPTCYALDDLDGTIFYIRISRAARVYIQFNHAYSPTERARIARALSRGMIFLEIPLAKAGAEQWVFDTQSSALKKMGQLRLGFKPSPNEMVREIPLIGG